MSRPYAEALFRIQAVIALSKRPFGRPISVMPKPWYWLTGLVVVFAVIAMPFLVTAEYSRKESVRGWLVSRDGVARITHNAAGIVEGITVMPGESLQVGDPVIYLSRDTFLEDGRSSGDELMRELANQVAAIHRRVQLLRAEADVEQASIAAQLQGLGDEQNVHSRQKIEQQRRLDLASEQLARLRSVVHSGAVTDWQVLRQEDEPFVLKQALGQLQQSEMSLVREPERKSEEPADRNRAGDFEPDVSAVAATAANYQP